MPDLYPFVRPLLWRLPRETAHHVALWSLRLGLGRLATTPESRRSDPILRQRVWGLEFSNPIGIAAGFDKDAIVADQLLDLGYGSVEVGTVTPRPQRGRARPRLFRLDRDAAIINRMGFPSVGCDAVAARLQRRQPGKGILGVNIGQNSDTADPASDYVEGVCRMAPLADYLVINVSSPNTPGLRDLQRREALLALLQRVMAARGETAVRPPLLVKLAPDLSPEDRADIAAVALETGIDGLVIANTTIARPPGLSDPSADETGGLSGPALFERSTELLAEMYRLTNGRIPLIGVGGIGSADDAYAKIRAGATLVQLHTALVFAGINVLAEIKSGLIARLEADGFSSITQAVGSGHERIDCALKAKEEGSIASSPCRGTHRLAGEAA
ncbi:MAG: quinone-dependent dihydroorotate dehydrogenase [Alphaproteobacteria bacterium]|nr:quinone-dependent dihydroorotate dehydrogenase [Alphaproteobacteria bacterium]